MPELPEVERAAGALRRAIAGKTIARVSVLHPAQRRTLPPRASRALRGATVERVTRRGKHQLLELADGRTLHVHFRMAGDWQIDTVDLPIGPRARVVIEFTDGARVSLVDPRALSTMSLHAAGQSALPDLGPEPADPTLTPTTLRASLRTRRGPIKPVLLDQRVIAGIGNIYASEALWRARIDPRAPATDLAMDRIRTLLAAIRHVLGAAAQLPGRYKDAAGSRRIAVYGRAGKPCRRCSTSIERIVQAGRSTFYCPVCQAT